MNCLNVFPEIDLLGKLFVTLSTYKLDTFMN